MQGDLCSLASERIGGDVVDLAGVAVPQTRAAVADAKGGLEMFGAVAGVGNEIKVLSSGLAMSEADLGIRWLKLNVRGMNLSEDLG